VEARSLIRGKQGRRDLRRVSKRLLVVIVIGPFRSGGTGGGDAGDDAGLWVTGRPYC